MVGGELVGRTGGAHPGRLAGDPAASELTYGDGPDVWVIGTSSAILSVTAHLLLIGGLSMLPFGSPREAERGAEAVLIGIPNRPILSQAAASSESFQESFESEIDRPFQEAAPTPLPPLPSVALSPVAPPLVAPARRIVTPEATVSSGPQNLTQLPVLASGGAAGEWEIWVETLRRDGLEVVIVFDSTSSMERELREVKVEIERIAVSLLRLIPKTRIAMAAYRDYRDDYIVRGQTLTNDVADLQRFLVGIHAAGGGDRPEAVHEGLSWAVHKNEFRPEARKVVLIFGDAPPHRQHLAACLETAAAFHAKQRGIVSTVTCRNNEPLSSFVEIARSGGGEAFLSQDERQIMTQLLVLVFGSQHRDQVLDLLLPSASGR